MCSTAPCPSKCEVRKALRQKIRTLSPESIADRSQKACGQLLQTPEYLNAEIVLVFLSLPTEIDTTPLVLDCWLRQKRVLAPLVNYDIRRMIPVEINSIGDLQPDQFGVRQPVRGQPIPASLIDLILVPGLGFDHAGRRMGRGGGFYDRFLSDPRIHAITCGLAFDELYIPELPVAPHDRSVNMLITDQRTVRFPAA